MWGPYQTFWAQEIFKKNSTHFRIFIKNWKQTSKEKKIKRWRLYLRLLAQFTTFNSKKSRDFAWKSKSMKMTETSHTRVAQHRWPGYSKVWEFCIIFTRLNFQVMSEEYRLLKVARLRFQCETSLRPGNFQFKFILIVWRFYFL